MKSLLKKNNCPKCGGRLFLVNDIYGLYEQCLQCSLVRYLDVIYQSGGGAVDPDSATNSTVKALS